MNDMFVAQRTLVLSALVAQLIELLCSMECRQPHKRVASNHHQPMMHTILSTCLSAVETYGHLGEPTFELLARLARVAAESGKVDEGKFIENTLKEMSVALCRGNGSILAAGQKVLAQVTGHEVQPGLPRPRADLI